MKKAQKTVFTCQDCGYTTPKWMGKCPDCGQWHSMVEGKPKAPSSAAKAPFDLSGPESRPVPIDSVDGIVEDRLATGIMELDRVLGGGLVAGSMVLIGGDPGIGKSTLMLQTMQSLAYTGMKVLYVSGEESVRQIKLRSQRTGSANPNLFVYSEIVLEQILDVLDQEKPQAVVLDSVQTLYSQDLTSAPGSVSQVREVTFKLAMHAKKTGIPTFLVGHVTKDGAIAGPRLLEHMVDTVLYFEGERNHIYRVLRAVKNRFGSTNEIGVFEMAEHGLMEVSNPSAVFLSERPEHASGSAVTASLEGSRPILLEIQALASTSSFASPRRTVLGLDSNKVALLVAVLEKKVGMPLMDQDVFMNVAGGVRVTEPAVDLAMVGAVASSFLDRPVPRDTVLMGEVGLTGEIRGVGQMETRIKEAAKMGFEQCLAPASSLRNLRPPSGVKVVGVKSVSQALEHLF